MPTILFLFSFFNGASGVTPVVGLLCFEAVQLRSPFAQDAELTTPFANAGQLRTPFIEDAQGGCC